eukprot:TRINITY_DN16021_c0_g1_i1.p1 TRINITY_DN16021_c0_g1~~TRINITY_DN16021_c0_g1_i1.p1  ORF type:complete len:311 (+),score=78.20 TRINITY_DN16021_c0_g1_i1:3-935(+)
MSLPFEVRFNGTTIIVPMERSDTVAQLKAILESTTGVRADRQKLTNLKVGSRMAPDDVVIGEATFPSSLKLLLVGSREEDLRDIINTQQQQLPPEEIDFEEDVPIEQNPELLQKVANRIKSYKPKILDGMREGKKLLVLDIDYTLFDHRSAAENVLQLARPFLHEFLESAYQDYDIVIWSATSMSWIELKMKELKVTGSERWKIAAFVDCGATISIITPEHGMHSVKPLAVIWGTLGKDKTNTIMFDDLKRNFVMNPQNGLKIKSFRDAFTTGRDDAELPKLAAYLKKISVLPTLEGLDHSVHYFSFHLF